MQFEIGADQTCQARSVAPEVRLGASQLPGRSSWWRQSQHKSHFATKTCSSLDSFPHAADTCCTHRDVIVTRVIEVSLVSKTRVAALFKENFVGSEFRIRQPKSFVLHSIKSLPPRPPVNSLLLSFFGASLRLWRCLTFIYFHAYRHSPKLQRRLRSSANQKPSRRVN